MNQCDSKLNQSLKRPHSALDCKKAATSSNSNKSRDDSGTRNADSTDSVPEFIQKLFRMLENKAFWHTFCWGPDGTTFIVKDTNEFSKSILPKHFKHCNFASFVRQLNKYDFHKVRNTDDGSKRYGDQPWEFVHPKFRRDRKDLLEQIRRKTPAKQKKDAVATETKHESQATSSTFAEQTQQEGNQSFSSSSDSVAELRQMAQNLQAKINELQKAQLEMDSNLKRLEQNDKLILNEFASLNQNLAAKDQLIREFLQLAAVQEEKKRNGSMSADHGFAPATQSLADAYSQIASSSTQQMETLSKSLQPLVPTQITIVKNEAQNANVEIADKVLPPEEQPAIRTQSSIPTLPVNPSANMQLPCSDSAAAAAASMNAGSIIGSPLKTSDGLAFVTFGRLTPKMSIRDNKTSLEIEMTPGLNYQQQHQQQEGYSSVQNNASSTRVKSNAAGWTVSPRVLLVDDDSVYRDISGRLLQVVGCTIDLAKDGVEAIHMMGLRKYDLILMDIVMPNLDGISATKNIRKYDVKTPIISMTSNFSDSDIVQYAGSGMTDILPKPFTKNTLYSMLEKYCAHLRVIHPNIVHMGLGLLPSSEASTSGSSSSSTSYIQEIGHQCNTTAADENVVNPVPTCPLPTYPQSIPAQPTVFYQLSPYPSCSNNPAVEAPLAPYWEIPSQISAGPATPLPLSYGPTAGSVEDATGRKRRRIDESN